MDKLVENRATDLLDDELWNGAYHSQKIHDYFVRAHALQETDKSGSDTYHRFAIEALDDLAEALGLELVARENVEGSR